MREIYSIMEEIIPIKPDVILETPVSKKVEAKAKFVPKGAIAFFILLVLLGLFIWFGIYFLMLDRT